ncbi:DUF692 domain-containing protein [Neptuniibacter sp. CAU 1671]|uniref:HvfB family MNIO-type RiPP peptide maturase n=1 Tax=Neptuniibacter sp. CAU 1671 TaxID=3032593 RepID=UPI0023DC2AAF|nr:DUF692 domain-containing protein [Neptuniibacter sp. CAU 1671]MDF2181459.1 DUF692 domain-containing protein [Neptuniibacter sp. CAU 1671]
MKQNNYPVSGAGLGFRRCMLDELINLENPPFGFLEVAPENWMTLGGRMGRVFQEYTQRFPFMAHGLSLSIAGPTPLDMDFLRGLKTFFAEHNIRGYSEHLSYCSDDGHLYDLMPIPFTEEAVHYVAKRIRTVQEVLERPLAMENVSYYAAPGAEMTEQEFLLAVLEEADCQLLLDINNIYVNSVNHRYDAEAFLRAMPPERVMYLHIAGHFNEAEDLIVDTHGSNVVDPVWQLLDVAYEHLGVVPTLLERDFNIPPLPELMQEVDTIVQYQTKWQNRHAKTVA